MRVFQLNYFPSQSLPKNVRNFSHERKTLLRKIIFSSAVSSETQLQLTLRAIQTVIATPRTPLKLQTDKQCHNKKCKQCLICEKVYKISSKINKWINQTTIKMLWIIFVWCLNSAIKIKWNHRFVKSKKSICVSRKMSFPPLPQILTASWNTSNLLSQWSGQKREYFWFSRWNETYKQQNILIFI